VKLTLKLRQKKKNARGTNIFHRISISTQFCYYFFANKSQFLKKKIDSEIAMMWCFTYMLIYKNEKITINFLFAREWSLNILFFIHFQRNFIAFGWSLLFLQWKFSDTFWAVLKTTKWCLSKRTRQNAYVHCLYSERIWLLSSLAKKNSMKPSDVLSFFGLKARMWFLIFLAIFLFIFLFFSKEGVGGFFEYLITSRKKWNVAVGNSFFNHL